MRCRMEEISKELIREKVKVQRLEATLSQSQPNVNITSLVNSSAHPKSGSSRRSRGEGKHRGHSTGSDEVVHRRRSSARSRRHHDNENTVARAQIVTDLRRLSNRSSSGSDCYHDKNENKNTGKVAEQSSVSGQTNTHKNTTPSSNTRDNKTPYPEDLPPLPRKLSTLSRRRVVGVVPPAPPAPPAPQNS